MTHEPKVLLAKVGLDGHDRGVKVVAKLLQTAGMEVIYLGIHQRSEAIVEAAIQEDVDVIGLSSLGGAHLQYAEKILALLRERGLEVPVILGGTLPVEDIPRLEAIGIRAVFPAGTRAGEFEEKIRQLAASHRARV
ncbi:MAG TPA: cobalamin-dependent protein [Candidatus Binataceae bacterium]|nr:cobalamin-dependent protein [Candidatus Binataceae bacterium]